jgi:hypothetical protein
LTASENKAAAAVNGRLIERLTNVTTGTSIVVNISERGRFVLHANGSITWDANGRWFLVRQSGSQFDVCAAVS